MPPRMLLGPAFQGLALLALLLVGARVAGGQGADGAPAGSAVPPAAQALATRLGIAGPPVLGDQPQGVGGPWALWLTKVPVVRGGNGTTVQTFRATGRVLSAGPAGAQGAFSYFALPASFPGGNDPYHGPPLAPARAIQLVTAWLRQAGAPVPSLPAHVHVEAHGGSTVVGGTGICCYTALDVVYFQAGADEPGPLFRGPVVAYVADAGAIVQVNGAGAGPGGTAPSRCRQQPQPDANGVPLGPSCFDDQAAAGDQLVVGIGGHEPWHADPAQIVRTFAYGGKLTASADWAPLAVLAATPRQAVYGLTAHGIAYRFTLVPAFPGLPGSVWRLVDIEHTPVVAASGSGAAATTDLPVLPCTTTAAVTRPALPALPRALAVTASPALAVQLATYSDGALAVLAPTGWRCVAAVGADGSQQLVVTPPDQQPAVPTTAVAPRSGEAITAIDPGACQGCVATLACHLFPAANAGFGFPCATAPAEERVMSLTPTVRLFDDPVGIAGEGTPSGGPYPANGLLMFSAQTAQGLQARQATCTLPDAQHALCTVILDDFLKRFPLR